MKFYENQCELNRQHELRMMKMMMRFIQPAAACLLANQFRFKTTMLIQARVQVVYLI